MSSVVPKIAILCIVTPAPIWFGVSFVSAARSSFRDGDRLSGFVAAFSALMAFVCVFGVFLGFFAFS